MKSATISTATLDNLQISFVVTVAGKLKNSFFVQTHCWISSVQHHESRIEDDDELLFWTYKTTKTIYTHTHRYMHKQNQNDIKIPTHHQVQPHYQHSIHHIHHYPTPPQMAEYTCPTQKRGENVSIKMGIIIDMIPIISIINVHPCGH